MVIDDSLYEETFDINDLKELIRRIKEGRQNISLEELFRAVLGPYYEQQDEEPNMDRMVGHVIYRLSDGVPEEERRRMAIYPFSTGSLIPRQDSLRVCDSLEDWRGHWEKLTGYNITKLAELPPSVQDIPLLNDQKP